MADELLLEIVTPEKLAFSDVVEEVTLSGIEGEFGVLKGHTPLLSSVKGGELNYTKDGRKTYYYAGTGYAEVTHTKVTVLVEELERADAIVRADVERERSEAESKLSKLSKEDPEYDEAKDDLAKANGKIKVAEKAA